MGSQDADRPLLVLNVGSSSLKAAVVGPSQERLWEGQQPLSAAHGTEAALTWLELVIAPWRPQLALIGHRVVHGGGRFNAPTRITPELEKELEALVPLAPLHNGPALEVIRWLALHWQAVPQWACFDTAFHHTLPEEAYSYALPAAWRQQGLRRFGFHGINHQHVSETVAARLGTPPGLKLISAHLGAGCSLAAISDGRSIDTTMGFTPMEGLVMASRSGSVDPGLLFHQLRQGLSLAELEQALTHQGGLLGLSEFSGDWMKLRAAAIESHPGARLARSVFLHRLRQGIGAMAASLGGLDVLALSGGIGANDPELADELAQSLGWLGAFELIRIPADEEGQIARQCRRAQAEQATAPS